MAVVSVDVLSGKVTQIKGVAEYFARLLSNKGIFTIRDLLEYFPIRYEDRSLVESIEKSFQRSVTEENYVPVIVVQCISKSALFVRGKSIPKFVFSDGNNEISLVAFSPTLRYFKIGTLYFITGVIKFKYNEYQMSVHDYEEFEDDETNSLNLGRIVPIYSSTEGLSQKKIRTIILNAFVLLEGEELNYSLPDKVITRYKLEKRKKNLLTMHFPETNEDLASARNQLVFEEFYVFQQKIKEKRKKRRFEKEKNRYKKTILVDLLIKNLPFLLTDSQKNVLEEIKKDMNGATTMYRLLQGDVGSGKTIVALISALLVVDSGFQVAIMAPTDILARQHYKNIESFVSPLGVKTALLTSSVPVKDREESAKNIAQNNISLVVGTHSLFQEAITYFDLKYIVVDEQHRFGVKQRELLFKKGDKADILMMSATPIPRTLSYSIFGELDMSVIDSLPDGRGEKYTKILHHSSRSHGYDFLMDRISKGEQGYIIFPVVEESVQKDLKSLKKEYKFLKKNVFKAIPAALVYSGIDFVKREKIMKQFASGEIKILLATTVLEVGIDNPNATVMIIESAERFGLSQLHQLRGRIGRSEKKSYCYVIPGEKSKEFSLQRLDLFSKTNDGFKISEYDLKIRGPGDFIGTKQSGLPPFILGDVVDDIKIMKRAAQEVNQN